MSYVLAWYEKDGNERVGEVYLSGVDEGDVRHEFGLDSSEPAGDCLEVTGCHVGWLNGAAPGVEIKLGEFEYFVEAVRVVAPRVMHDDLATLILLEDQEYRFLRHWGNVAAAACSIVVVDGERLRHAEVVSLVKSGRITLQDVLDVVAGELVKTYPEMKVGVKCSGGVGVFVGVPGVSLGEVASP